MPDLTNHPPDCECEFCLEAYLDGLEQDEDDWEDWNDSWLTDLYTGP